MGQLAWGSWHEAAGMTVESVALQSARKVKHDDLCCL